METTATIECLLFDMLTCDPRDEERAAVLADFLKVDLDALDSDDGDPPTFTVDDHPIKRGTGPDEARRLCSQLRDCARIVFGDEVDEWTTGALAKASIAAKAHWAATEDALVAHREHERDAMNEHAEINADLSAIRRMAADADAARKRLYHAFGKATGLSDGDEIDKAAASAWARVRPPALADVARAAQEAQGAIIATRATFRTYHNIETALRANADAAALIKAARGFHEIVNTLYFLSPDSADYDHASAHRAALHQAFDGEPVTDSRTDARANAGEYRVLTETEANDEWDRSLDSYLDGCVLPELPEQAQQYFDRESWTNDARSDGRASAISRYDGEEHEHHGLIIIREN